MRWLPILLTLATVWTSGSGTAADDDKHWSFRVPVRPPIPVTRTEGWARTPIDHFILAQLEAKGLKPAPEADRKTLARRLYYDLTGLPPTPGQMQAFLHDTAPDAYERLVDQLLASPHFGERWAQHWLDLVRYGETNGFELDADRPNAWRYRDYVVQSFNADKPYDQFLTEQLAGDLLLKGQDVKQRPELLIATGMHRCGPNHVVSGNLDLAEIRQENLTEMVNGVGAVVLGLTLGCARCHDHKFDPISIDEYYQFQAFFASSYLRDIGFATAKQKEAIKAKTDAIHAQTAPLKKQVAEIESPYRAKLAQMKRDALEPEIRQAFDTPADKRTPEQKKLVKESQSLLNVSWDEVLEALNPEDRKRREGIRQQIHRLELEIPPPAPAAWAVVHEDPIPKTHVLKRGDVHRKGDEVQPGFPKELPRGEKAPKDRLDLARWVTQADHPLTARVMMNRLWHYYFGKGIVATTNDFGIRGDRPSHPELLDFLAREFTQPTEKLVPGYADSAWAMKRMHRLILTSAAYRQASDVRVDSDTLLADPDNRLLWKQNRKRMDAEAIRDSMITATGHLNREAGGLSVRIPLEPEVYELIFTEAEPDNLWPVTPDPRQHDRRSLYLFAKRNVKLPILEAFDQPDALNPCGERGVSTFAPQALILMNGPIARDQSQRLAHRLLWEGTNTNAWIHLLFQRVLYRDPTAEELAAAREFLQEQTKLIRSRPTSEELLSGVPAGIDRAEATALADLCLAILNTNEFMYIP